VEQLQLAQQIEMLQAQQQQIAATHQQYVNMGMIPQQQQLPTQYEQLQGQMQNLQVNQNNAFQQMQHGQMGQMGQQQIGVPMTGGMGAPGGHRRNQSAMPNMGMGPPPAPSSGASGFGNAGDFSFPAGQNRGENNTPRGGRGGGSAGSGHARRHSLALPEAKKAAEAAEAKRKTSGFQFPIPGTNASASSPAPTDRTESPGNQADTLQTPTSATRGGMGARGGHGRSQSMAVGGRGMGSMGGFGIGFNGPCMAPLADLLKRRRKKNLYNHGGTVVIPETSI
jgi:protein SSD1